MVSSMTFRGKVNPFLASFGQPAAWRREFRRLVVVPASVLLENCYSAVRLMSPVPGGLFMKLGRQDHFGPPRWNRRFEWL